MIPFTITDFLRVFRDYNLAIWPAQVLLNAVAFLAIAFAVKREKEMRRLPCALLAVLWLWSGIVYHFVFFTKVTAAAIGFGAMFVLEALIIAYAGMVRGNLRFYFRVDVNGILGLVVLLYALIGYPVLSYAFGHTYPTMPTFGVPCPITIFTFGLFAWSCEKLPPSILLIPLLWSFVGISAAISLGMIEDVGLIIAAVVTSALNMRTTLAGDTREL